jgi:site-specific recombinase XerD
MKPKAPSIESTELWIREYTARSRGNDDSRRVIHTCIRQYQEFYQARHPGCSFLESLDNSEPVQEWYHEATSRLSPRTAGGALAIVKGFTAWLLLKVRVDDDIFFYLPTSRVARVDLPALWLRHNLQREILSFRETLRGYSATFQQRCARAAHSWNLYLNLRTSHLESPPQVTEEMLLGHLTRISRQAPSLAEARQQLSDLERFLDFLVDRGRLPDNPLREFLLRYRSRSTILQVLEGSPPQSSSDAAGALEQVRRRPFFCSALAGHMQKFLKMQTELGKRYESSCYMLRVLDRVLLRHGVQEPAQITPVVIEAYLSEKNPSARTRNMRLRQLQIFCRHLRRLGAEVPDSPNRWPWASESTFRPHIFTLQEVGMILEEVRRMGESSAHPCLFRGLETILYLLYACGMRLSETLNLRLKDVDLEERVAFVACAKFYKERWVPFCSGTARRLEEYLDLRQAAFPNRSCGEEPFFLNSCGRPFSRITVQEVFKQVRATLGLGSRGTDPPRLHDFRHSFAVHRLYKWYAEGADVQNRLPLLSTYMGHINIHSTEVYLHLTQDLLRQAGGNFRLSFEQVVQRWVPEDDTSS